MFDCIICGGPSVQFSNSSCSECSKLVDVAVEALRRARRDGVPKYGPNLWKTLSVTEHLEHAKDHLDAVYHSNAVHENQPCEHDTSGEDHLSHAICRLVMAKALLDE